MARILEFRSDVHIYELDGEIVPSVSEICRFIDREIYGDVNQYVLDNAAHRGTKVHKATEALDKFGEIECDEDIILYVQAYVKFRREHKCEWHRIEWSTYNTEQRYAMTADRVGIMDGKSVLLDIKTTSSIQTAKVTAQLTLYKMALETQGVLIDECYALRLDKSGKYQLKKIEPDIELATSLLYLHRILQKKPKRKKVIDDVG